MKDGERERDRKRDRKKERERERERGWSDRETGRKMEEIDRPADETSA